MHAAWTYNLIWMMLTWGVEFLLWITRRLFKSEGGLIDHLYIIIMQFGVINVFLVYWLIDFMILKGTLEYTGLSKNIWYAKFGGLVIIQFVTTMFSLLMKPSIMFDWNLATSDPVKITDAPVDNGGSEIDNIPDGGDETNTGTTTDDSTTTTGTTDPTTTNGGGGSSSGGSTGPVKT